MSALNATFVEVMLPSDQFNDVYHVLQVPVFFLAGAGHDAPFFLATIGTAREPVGEGPADTHH